MTTSNETAFSRRSLHQLLILVLILTLAIAIPLGTAKAYTGFPTIAIVSVEKDVSVTIQAGNLPPNQTFTVRMGKMGTLAVGGEIVKTFDSGTGAAQKLTLNIPASLKGQAQIAIRMDSAPGGWFAYDFFINSVSSTAVPTTVGGSTATPTKTPTGPTPTRTPTGTLATKTPTKVVTPAATKIPGYSGIPTISIIAVVKDSTVTIKTNNYPPNQVFTVRMGAFGTKGIGGTIVGTTDSGKGGVFEATYNIPEALKGKLLISIRLDSPAGFFSYNWFWNNNAP